MLNALVAIGSLTGTALIAPGRRYAGRGVELSRSVVEANALDGRVRFVGAGRNREQGARTKRMLDSSGWAVLIGTASARIAPG